MRRSSSRLLLAAATLAWAGPADACRGQFAAVASRDGDVTVIRYRLIDNILARSVFGDRASGRSARTRLEAELDGHLAAIVRACDLSGEQAAKLRLAGRGDIKRFLDRFDEIGARYEGREVDQQEMNRASKEIAEVRAAFEAGVFGDDSLLARTARGTLRADQLARLSQIELDKRALRYEAVVEVCVEQIGRSCALTVEQRGRLKETIHAETRPPRSFGSQEMVAVLYQITKIPEGKLRPIFDDAQWRGMSRHLMQARAYENFLKRSGYEAADGDD